MKEPVAGPEGGEKGVANGKLGTYVIPPNGFAGKGFVPNYANGFKTARKSTIPAGTSVPNLEKYAAYDGEDPTAQKRAINAREILKGKAEKQRAKDGLREKLNAANKGVGLLLPNIKYADEVTGYVGSFMKGKERIPFILDDLAVRGPNVPNAVDQAADPRDEKLKKSIYRSIITESTKFGSLLGGGKLKPTKLFNQLRDNKGAIGAVNSAVGAGFEAAVLTAYPSERFSNKEVEKINVGRGADRNLLSV